MDMEKSERLEEIKENLPRYIKLGEDNRLHNVNTGRMEGIEGDVVDYTVSVYGIDVVQSGHVIGYTDYQFVNTEEYGAVILTRENGLNKRIIPAKY